MKLLTFALASFLTIASTTWGAITHSITIQPSAPQNTGWTTTLAPNVTATLTITVKKSEVINGVIYQMKNPPPDVILNPAIGGFIWITNMVPTATDYIITCHIVNTSAGALTAAVLVKCIWTPYGPGTGSGPPDILGLADGTATRSGGNVSWSFDRIVQRADGVSAINWHVEVNLPSGALDPGATITGVSAVNLNPTPGSSWPITQTGTGPQRSGTVKSSTPSTGQLRVSFTGPAGSPNTADTVLTFATLEVTNIKFNFDETSSANDAINIRKDFTHPYNMANGEWIKGGANLPICYTINKTVKIKARFTALPLSVTTADISALVSGANPSLGNVKSTPVTFVNGISTPEYVTLEMATKTPNAVKKSTADVWQWKAGNINSSGSTPLNMNGSGPHTIYTIFNEPTAPWINTAANQRNAWATALEFAIVTCGADGKATENNAMQVVTTHLYTIPYDGASQCLLGGGNFSYTSYMTTTLANCIDSAVGLDTTGSLLGMELAAKRRTWFFGFNFHCFVKKGTFVYDSCSAMSLCVIRMGYANYITAGTPGPLSVESNETYPIE